jgi:outer membrane protein
VLNRFHDGVLSEGWASGIRSFAIAMSIGALLFVPGARATAQELGRDDSDFQIRVRAIYLNPNRPVILTANLAGNFYPELSGEWFLLPGWSTELAIALPTDFNLSDGTTIRMMPNTWTVKYEIPTGEPAVHPYLGFGLDYSRLSLYTHHPLDYDSIDSSSVGWVAQAGAEARVAPGWLVNLDLRYLGDLEPRSFQGPSHQYLGTKYKIDPFLLGVGVSCLF